MFNQTQGDSLRATPSHYYNDSVKFSEIPGYSVHVVAQIDTPIQCLAPAYGRNILFSNTYDGGTAPDSPDETFTDGATAPDLHFYFSPHGASTGYAHLPSVFSNAILFVTYMTMTSAKVIQLFSRNEEYIRRHGCE